MSERTLRLHFRERAADDGTGGGTLVFLHYFGGSGRSWEPVIEIMTERGFRCIAPDLRGFGESSTSCDDPSCYSVMGMACDVLELVRRLKLEAFALVGHSMGGKVALALGAGQPAGLTAVVLIAPSPPTPEPISDEERARLLAGYGDAAAAIKTLRKITERALSEQLFEKAIADQLRASEHAWRAWLDVGSREDISAQLSAIRSPVAIAVGAADETITESLVRREIVGRLEVPTPVRVIRDAGHLLPLEAPLATANFIAEAVGRKMEPR